MKVIEKLELLKTQENDFVKNDSKMYEKALDAYKEMLQNDITKPRGYCLSSIADYTAIAFSNDDLSNSTN